MLARGVLIAPNLVEKTDMENLDELSSEVRLLLNHEISFNYVSAPTRFDVQKDILLGLKRFKNAVRWRTVHTLGKIALRIVNFHKFSNFPVLFIF